MKPTIGGNVCIRDGNRLDFCWQAAVKSLLPVCDQVVLCDGESRDGTQEEIREWLKSEPKLRLCVYPWPDPKGNPSFWVEWLNYCREHVRSDWHLQLDADEVLHENSYDEVLRFVRDGGYRAATCTRHNFWRDHRHLIPDGECLGRKVNRLAPQSLWMASDGSHPLGAPLSSIAVPTGIEIFHYGFLRTPSAFFEKEKLLQRYFFDSHDQRLEIVERKPGNWMDTIEGVHWITNLEDYNGEHPALMRQWLRDHGYN